jgi:hypothetical protein
MFAPEVPTAWLGALCRTDIDDDYRFVYMGPKGSWTPLHSGACPIIVSRGGLTSFLWFLHSPHTAPDHSPLCRADVFGSYSWSANVCGRKRWVFFPPEQGPLLKVAPHITHEPDRAAHARLTHALIPRPPGQVRQPHVRHRRRSEGIGICISGPRGSLSRCRVNDCIHLCTGGGEVSPFPAGPSHLLRPGGRRDDLCPQVRSTVVQQPTLAVARRSPQFLVGPAAGFIKCGTKRVTCNCFCYRSFVGSSPT